MTFESLLDTATDGTLMFPLLGSLIAGALVGAEREVQGKPAGLRTHTLVCFASALMTLIAMRMGDWELILPAGGQIITDMSRMPHAILTGIGFLCAGVIFREGASVHGLTTAASLWLIAALGITFGAGLLELATLGTIIALVVLALMRAASSLAPLEPEIRVMITATKELGTEDVTRILRQHDAQPGNMALSYDAEGGLNTFTFHAAVRKEGIDTEALVRALSSFHGVRSVSIAPLDKDLIR